LQEQDFLTGMLQMKRPFEDKEDDLFLVDLLLESNLTISEISRELGLPINEINRKIKSLGLGWVKSQKRKSSRGQAALTEVFKKLFPNQKIVNEFHIGEKLMLDVYCPTAKIAAEFHGRQHFYYTKRFFDSRYEFEEAQKRDIKKINLCNSMGITLVVFRYNDLLTEQAVYDRLLDAIRSSEFIPQKDKVDKTSITQNKFYQQAKKNYNQRKKDSYKKMKQRRKNHE
jgi:hypothetical protein